MYNKAQEIRDQLRRLETEAAKLVTESPQFHRAEHKIMTAANAVEDWLSANQALAPKPEEGRPARMQQQQQQPTKADFLSLYANAAPDELVAVKTDLEKRLAKKPDNARAQIALEAVTELLAAKAPKHEGTERVEGAGITVTS